MVASVEDSSMTWQPHDMPMDEKGPNHEFPTFQLLGFWDWIEPMEPRGSHDREHILYPGVLA